MTTKDVKQMSDEELNRACALAIGLGWRTAMNGHGGYWTSKEGKQVLEYQPTAPTEAGKAQCFDLMVKFIDESHIKNTLLRLINRKAPIQKAICQAVAMLGENDE